MADQSREARLNLVLSATDDASKVISDSISKIKRRFKDLANSLAEIFDSDQLTKPVAAGVNHINDELEKVNFNGLVKDAHQVGNEIVAFSDEVQKALVPIGTTAITVFQHAKDVVVSEFQGLAQYVPQALMPIEDTVTAVTLYIEDRFKKSSNVIDAEFKVISDEIVRDLDEIPKAAEVAALQLESPFQKAKRNIREIFKELNAELKALSKEGGKDGLLSVGGQMDTMWAGMAMLGAASQLTDLIKNSTNAWAEYDHQMRLVNQEMNLSGDRFKWLENRVIELSNQTGIAADELAKGLYNIAATGGKMADPINALNRLELVTKAMKAGNADLDTVTKALDSVMGAYGNTVKSDKEILDIMFAATNNGQMRFKDLAKSVGASATSAAAAKVSYAELAAAQAVLTNSGLNAQNASQRLNSLIIGIAASSPKAAQEAKNLGIAWGQSGLQAYGLSGILEQVRQKVGNNTEELKKLFPNQRAYLTALLLTGTAHDQYVQTLGKVKDAHDALDNALKKTDGDMHETLEKMKTSVQNAGMQLAVAMAPAVTQIANRVRELALWFQHLSPQTKKLIGDFLLGATALLTFGGSMMMAISGVGAVHGGVKRVVNAIKDLNLIAKGITIAQTIKKVIDVAKNLPMIGRFISLAFGPWGAVIAGVIAAGALLVANWDSVVKWVKDTFGIKLPSNFKEFQQMFQNVWNNVSKFFSDAWNTIKKVAMDVWNAIKPYLVEGVREVQRIWNQVWPVISQVFGQVWDGIQKLFKSAWHYIKPDIISGLKEVQKFWHQVWPQLKELFHQVWDPIVKKFKTVWNAIYPVIIQGLKEIQKFWHEVWPKIQEVFHKVWDAVSKAFHQAWDKLYHAIMNGIKEVQKYWNEIWPQVQQVFQKVWEGMKVFWDILWTLWTSYLKTSLDFILSHWQNIWNMVKDSFKATWDWIVMIFSVLWHTFSGLFKVALDILTGHWDKAWKDVKEMFVNIWHDISDGMGRLINDALDWGKNLLKMLADGIEAGIHWVEGAVSKVAKKISDYLGFHSPTKEGYASDSDKWAPNFIKMFVDGLDDNKILVELAANRIAQAMKKGIHFTPAQKMKILYETQQMVSMFKKTFHPIERVDPFLEPEAANAYDRIAGHGRNIPLTTTMYDRRAGHSAHHVNVHIHIDGRSQETDRQLLDMLQERLARQFRTHLSVQTSV